jgi:hypothetical protein
MQDSILKTRRIMKLLTAYVEVQEMEKNPELLINSSSEQTKSFVAGFKYAVNIVMGTEDFNDEEE